jgi:hypothetical protein
MQRVGKTKENKGDGKQRGRESLLEKTPVSVSAQPMFHGKKPQTIDTTGMRGLHYWDR